MNRFSEMRTAISLYKQKIDKLIRNYETKDAKNKEIYNETEYQRLHLENLADTRTKFSAEQEEIIHRVNSILEDVQQELSAWVALPVNSQQIQLISALMYLNIGMSKGELQALQTSVGRNYLANKLLVKLAESSGIKGIKMPFNLELYTGLLNRVKTETEIFIGGYCGGSNGYDEKYNTVHINLHTELLTDEYRPKSDNLIYTAASCIPLSGKSSILVAGSLWDGEHLPAANLEKLPSEAEDLLDEIFEGCQSEQDFHKTMDRLLYETPDIKQALLFSKYKLYVPKESEEDQSMTQ